MTVYAFSAPVGMGKTHTAMWVSRRLLQQGWFVASNVPVDSPETFPDSGGAQLRRLPMWPTVNDLRDLPAPGGAKGLVVLDDFDVMIHRPECEGVREWALTSAGHGWDVLITFESRFRNLIDDAVRSQFGSLADLSCLLPFVFHGPMTGNADRPSG